MRNAPSIVFGMALLSAAAVGGCLTSPNDFFLGEGGGGGGSSVAGSDLPCDVADLIATHCLSCHQGSDSTGGVDLSGRAALAAASPTMPDQTVAQRSVARMRDAAAPMPQAGLLPAADVTIFADWVSAGMPAGDCGSQPPPAQIVCTSNQFYGGGNDEGSKDMSPGQACIKCHSTPNDEGETEGPRFRFAGTVYPTPHEPDDCIATGVSGSTIVVTDANGATLEATVRAGGNFFVEGASIALPIKAEIRKDGKVLQMKDPVMSGDCNTCHTVDGTEGASGRIFPPG